jgi:hypothetical protein
LALSSGRPLGVKLGSAYIWLKSPFPSCVRQTLDEFEQPFADARALNSVIGADKFEGLSLGKRVRTLLFILYEAGHGFARDFRWHFLEEKGHRHIQDIRQRIEAACADAVGTTLVFLNLLECQPNSLAQFFLADVLLP